MSQYLAYENFVNENELRLMEISKKWQPTPTHFELTCQVRTHRGLTK